MARHLSPFLLTLALTVPLTSCTANAAQPARPARLQTVALGMGYVPNVQFAPFYMADALGLYRKAGITVRFDYGSSPNLLQLTAAGREQFAIADATDTITGVAHGYPVTGVASMYQRLPVTIFSLARRHIRTVSELKGKTLGIPGRFGSSWVALLTALRAAGLPTSSLTIRTIGYTQAESVVQGTVDAAVGYSNNEPILLKRRGYKVSTQELGGNLVGAGLVAGNSLIAHNPRLVRSFVQATLAGMRATINNPKAAFAVCRKVKGLQDLSGRNVGDQYAVLLKTIAFWRSAGTRAYGLGYADPAQWRHSIADLRAIGQINKIPSLSSVETERFIAGAPHM